MGMFDCVRCRYSLPLGGVQDLVYQTKDTPAQFMELYEIREDGSLWHEAYDMEDRSDPQAAPGSLHAFMGCMTPVRQRWEPMSDFTGEVRFYTSRNDDEWIEFSAYFVQGHLRQLETISPVVEPQPAPEEASTKGADLAGAEASEMLRHDPLHLVASRRLSLTYRARDEGMVVSVNDGRIEVPLGNDAYAATKHAIELATASLEKTAVASPSGAP